MGLIIKRIEELLKIARWTQKANIDMLVNCMDGDILLLQIQICSRIKKISYLIYFIFNK